MSESWIDMIQIAEHEATHAIAAQKMGLPVSWVTIDPGRAEGIDFGAAVKIPDEQIDYERDVFAICVAMSAPSHIRTHRGTPIGRYAQLEYQLALEVAGRHGITAAPVYDRSAEIVSEHWFEIVDLAQRLEEERTVSFETTLA